MAMHGGDPLMRNFREIICRYRHRLIGALCVLACVVPLTAATPSPTPLRVAAASDVAFALPELIALHQQMTPGEITTTLGSSGLLARQIAQGAPFDVLFSANVAFVDALIVDGHAQAASKAVYARGRIVLWSKSGGVALATALDDLRDPRFQRIAIATPEHAPYGLAAKQALIKAGLWDDLRPRLVYGENITQALQIAASGNADVAIVALSLAIPTPGGAWTLVDDALHQPMDQALVVTTRSNQPAAATAFTQTVNSPEGRAILARFGLVLPGETLDPAILDAAQAR